MTGDPGRTAGGRRSRLLGRDVLGLGTTGLRARPMRAFLSALGIAIGIAAMIAVVGISSSSQARLQAQLAQLGTNLLTVQPGKSLLGTVVTLPEDTVGKVGLLGGVEQVGGAGAMSGLSVYRSSMIDPAQSGGLGVTAVTDGLFDVVGGTLAAGEWLNAATGSFPTVVLGSKAAERLGIATVGSVIQLGGEHFTVVGVLDPVALAPELDTTAMIGQAIAADRFGFDGKPTTVYERSPEELVPQVRALLPRTVSPSAPEEVSVSRPSDALAAKNAADQAFTGLLLGLGSVALLVGGIGVANTMVISVLERRREIGLRRALGATRGHIRSQFLMEALLLSALGGVAGALLGTGVTSVVAAVNGWPISVPPEVLLAGIAATLVIGAIAGLYPAIRAARTPPTSALSG
ncbi:ABC transporter permease [Rathayibacter tanaceti]|uniref:FtsX-like permease family protein n=2 Tax=Rathayibacter tanaceti TaxID=1671680 RepID=A0A162GR62_9MICO|nr:ABC transporter permease [Rathayibacter tanaceti]KZX21468.1 Macrolide export ATP-binding/permease protein MacB [Rathayibacter tanaceti]QHC54367.1 FtsX-like permease family protein [Rathayibacter tanaceti]TCO38050.1 putative ABC transport system permease protein [Rathayibacter tanaceti]